MNELLFDIEYNRKKLDSLKYLIEVSDLSDKEKAHHTLSLCVEALKFAINKNNTSDSQHVGLSIVYKHDKFYFYYHLVPQSGNRFDLNKHSNIIRKDNSYFLNLDAHRNETQSEQRFNNLLEIKSVGIFYWCYDCLRLGAYEGIGDILKLSTPKDFSIGGERKVLVDYRFNDNQKNGIEGYNIWIEETVSSILSKPIDIKEREKYISIFPSVFEKILLQSDLLKKLESNKKAIKV